MKPAHVSPTSNLEAAIEELLAAPRVKQSEPNLARAMLVPIGERVIDRTDTRIKSSCGIQILRRLGHSPSILTCSGLTTERRSRDAAGSHRPVCRWLRSLAEIGPEHRDRKRGNQSDDDHQRDQ